MFKGLATREWLLLLRGIWEEAQISESLRKLQLMGGIMSYKRTYQRHYHKKYRFRGELPASQTREATFR